MINAQHAILMFTHLNIDFRPSLICAAREARRIKGCKIIVSGNNGEPAKLKEFAIEISRGYGVDATYREIAMPPEVRSKKSFKLNAEAESLRQMGYRTLTYLDNDIVFKEGTITGQLDLLRQCGPKCIIGPAAIRFVPPETRKEFGELAAMNNVEALERYPQPESHSIFHKAMKFMVSGILRKDIDKYQFQPPHLSGTMVTADLSTLPEISPDIFCEDAYLASFYFKNLHFSGKIYHPELVRYSWSKNPIFEYQSIFKSYRRFSIGDISRFIEYVDQFEKHTPNSEKASFGDWALFLSIVIFGRIKHGLMRGIPIRSYSR